MFYDKTTGNHLTLRLETVKYQGLIKNTEKFWVLGKK